MDESLEHLITSCHYSKNFWAEVIKWFDKQGIEIAHLSDKDVMLVIVRCDDELICKPRYISCQTVLILLYTKKFFTFSWSVRLQN